MLNYLSTTFIFGKQTKNNINIERFNAGLHVHSLIFVLAFPFWGRGGSSPRRARNTSRSTEIPGISAGFHTYTGPSKIADVVTSPGPWTNSGPLSRGYKL